jgi:hypothetical protein
LGTHYRILQNNEYGLVATFSVAEQSAVGESSVVINKTTGEFLFADALTGKEVMEEEEDGTVKALSKFNHGKCLHD